MQPLGDRLWVRLDEKIASASLIHIAPNTDRWRSKEGCIESENRGTVVLVGPGKRHPKTGVLLGPTVNAGDVVRFSELEYYSEMVDGEKHVLISESDVLFVEEV